MSRVLPASFVAGLGQFPEGRVSYAPEDLLEYGRDWTRVHDPAPAAVAFPHDTEEVARLLRLCQAEGVPVVPSGGRTGLAAGAVAARGEVVVSLTRMRRLDPVDLAGQTVRVGAGVVTEAVHRHCRAHGLTWPVDFASKGSSQVGGNVATNAGGARVIRYGCTRQWVLGLEVVLASGEVLELNGALEKNNTGCDLRQLFIGSEGTLGIVTAATLKLTRLPEGAQVALFGLPSIGAVLELFQAAREAPFPLAAYEFFTDLCLARLRRHRGLRAPLGSDCAYYVLLEAETDDGARVEDWSRQVLEHGICTDGVMAHGAAQAARLWAYREGISESLSATGFPHKNDVSLPVASLPAFCADLADVFARAYPGWEVCLFGHIGDGNVHINAMKPDSMARDEFLAQAEQADRVVFELVRRHRGSISAEHGIGLLKKPYLGYTRSPAEIAVLRTIKQALDPDNLLNPGKIMDP